MKITKEPTNITITFSPNNYWIRKNTKEPDWLGEYMLTARIDMSYAGKSDQEGPTILYLTKEQRNLFLDAGFNEIE